VSLDEIKKNLKSKNLIIGTKVSLKEMKLGNLQKLFLASNVTEELKNDIEHYSEIGGLKVEILTVPNDELGAICKKPFSISVIGLKKN